MASAKAPKHLSVSEIARNIPAFDLWAERQNLKGASIADLPPDLAVMVRDIFDVRGMLPMSLVDPESADFAHAKALGPTVLRFLQTAFAAQPSLFSANSQLAGSDWFSDLVHVQAASARHGYMAKSSVKWTEADRANQVYSLRVAAAKRTRLRHECRVGLSQPLNPTAGGGGSGGKPLDVSRAQFAIPDVTMFISATRIQSLSRGAVAAYNKLQACSAGVPFATNATPAAQLPERQQFEFASSVWEDKKPDQQDDGETAYRQNRMSTTAIVRHLHAFKVKVPVIGLIFAKGKVSAHVDWAAQEDGRLAVYSAPYSSGLSDDRRESDVSSASAPSDFGTWDLSEPAQILSLFLLIRRLDDWTVNGFCDLVHESVKALATKVRAGKAQFVPWKMTKPAARLSAARPAVCVKREEAEDVDEPKELASPSPRRSPRNVRRKKVVTKSPPEENIISHQPTVVKKQTDATNPPTPAGPSSRMVLRARK